MICPHCHNTGVLQVTTITTPPIRCPNHCDDTNYNVSAFMYMTNQQCEPPKEKLQHEPSRK